MLEKENGASVAQNVLEARGITKAFGGLLAVNAVDFDILTQRQKAYLRHEGESSHRYEKDCKLGEVG